MSNVVPFTMRAKLEEPTKDDILNDLVGRLIDWAEENGIDANTTDFKWDAATIRTVAQGALQRKDY
jgi:hypothetical protein